jgi:hypothetical protein
MMSVSHEIYLSPYPWEVIACDDGEILGSFDNRFDAEDFASASRLQGRDAVVWNDIFDKR